MSTTALNKKPASQFADKKLSFGGVLASEFLKFRTLTTNWVMTAVIAVVMIGLSLAGAAVTNLTYHNMQDAQAQVQASASAQAEAMQSQAAEAMPTDMPADMSSLPADTMPTDIPSDQASMPVEAAPSADASSAADSGMMGVESSTTDMSSQVFALGNMGIDMSNMLIAAVAVVFIAAEYATRSINTTMTVVPKRSMIFFAKLVVASIYSFVMGFVLSAAGFFLAYPLLDSAIRDQYPIEPGVWMNCLAVAVYFMMLSWMGLGFGALMRNNAGGIVLVVVCLFILPIVLLIFTAFGWVESAIDYLPNALGREMLAYQVSDNAKFNNVEAAGLLSLWCVIPALLGYLRIRFTDPK